MFLFTNTWHFTVTHPWIFGLAAAVLVIVAIIDLRPRRGDPS